MAEVKTGPVTLTVVPEIVKDTAPGAIQYWGQDSDAPTGFHFKCPCGCKAVGGVRLSGAGAWEWNGDKEKPTVSPSVLLYDRDMSSHWHGWLRNGIWESV